MAGATVTLPAIGEVKRVYLIGGAAVVVAVVGWSYMRPSSAGTDAGGAVDPGADPAGMDAYGSAGDGPIMSDTQPSSITVGADPDAITTNAQWAQRAVAALAELSWDPVLVARAVGKYLAGQGLTQQEADAVQTALGQLGGLPQGDYRPIIIAPVQTVPKPTPNPKPKPKPPTGNPRPVPAPVANYRIRPGDTLGKIAQKYRTSVAKLLRLNPKIKNPNRIRANDTIRVQ